MPAPLPRFGGGAPAPAVAMADMSGAGASGAAGFECTTGAVPPLTMRGASAGLMLAGAAAPEDLFALGEGMSSSERVLDATGAGVFAGTVSGCEFGTMWQSWVQRQTALRCRNGLTAAWLRALRNYRGRGLGLGTSLLTRGSVEFCPTEIERSGDKHRGRDSKENFLASAARFFRDIGPTKSERWFRPDVAGGFTVDGFYWMSRRRVPLQRECVRALFLQRENRELHGLGRVRWRLRRQAWPANRRERRS